MSFGKSAKELITGLVSWVHVPAGIVLTGLSSVAKVLFQTVPLKFVLIALGLPLPELSPQLPEEVSALALSFAKSFNSNDGPLSSPPRPSS